MSTQAPGAGQGAGGFDELGSPIPSDAPALGAGLLTLAPWADVPASVEVKETLAVIAAVGSLLTGGPAAGPAMRLLVSSEGCDIDGVNGGTRSSSVRRLLHPTQWAPSGDANVGMAVANTGVPLGLALLHFAGVRVAMLLGPTVGRRFLPKVFNDDCDYVGLCRFPAGPLIVYLFMYQGVTLGTFRVLYRHEMVGSVMAAVAVFVASLSVPFFVFKQLKRGVPSKGVHVEDPETTHPAAQIFFGSGEWCSVRRDHDWVNRWTTFVRYYRQEWSYYGVGEFAMTFLISAISAIRPQSWTECGHIKVGNGIVFLTATIMEAKFWPHARHRDSACDFSLHSAQFVAMMLMAVAYYAEDPALWTFGIALTLMVFAAMVLVVRTAMDLISELIVFCRGRRNRLQEMLFERNEAGEEAPLTELLGYDAMEEGDKAEDKVEDNTSEPEETTTLFSNFGRGSIRLPRRFSWSSRNSTGSPPRRGSPSSRSDPDLELRAINVDGVGAPNTVNMGRGNGAQAMFARGTADAGAGPQPVSRSFSVLHPVTGGIPTSAEEQEDEDSLAQSTVLSVGSVAPHDPRLSRASTARNLRGPPLPPPRRRQSFSGGELPRAQSYQV